MPFVKGQSGNPAGRRKGSKDRRTLVFEQLVPHGDELVSKAVSLALDGDPQMLALCLHKLIPNPKPVDRPIEVGTLGERLSEKGERVVDAMTTGKITPAEGTSLLSALSSQAKLVELDELLARVEALEHAAQS